MFQQLLHILRTSTEPNAYRLQLDGNRLVWVTHEDGKEVRYTSEPDAAFMKRFKAQVISWLPIEWLL